MDNQTRFLAVRTTLVFLALMMLGLSIDVGLTLGKDFEERQREISRGYTLDVDLPDGEKLLVWTSPDNGCISWDYKAYDGGTTAIEDECSDQWSSSMGMLLLGTVYGGCDCYVEAEEELILTEETHERLYRKQTTPLKATISFAVISLSFVYLLIVHKQRETK